MAIRGNMSVGEIGQSYKVYSLSNTYDRVNSSKFIYFLATTGSTTMKKLVS